MTVTVPCQRLSKNLPRRECCSWACPATWLPSHSTAGAHRRFSSVHGGAKFNFKSRKLPGISQIVCIKASFSHILPPKIYKFSFTVNEGGCGWWSMCVILPQDPTQRGVLKKKIQNDRILKEEITKTCTDRFIPNKWIQEKRTLLLDSAMKIAELVLTNLDVILLYYTEKK